MGGNKLSISALWKHAACNSNGETDVDREHLTSLSASVCVLGNVDQYYSGSLNKMGSKPRMHPI